MHLAAWYGHHRIIQLLLGAGAHIDAQRNGGYTPLHLASLWGKEDAVRELLKGGPDLEIKEEKVRLSIFPGVCKGRGAKFFYYHVTKVIASLMKSRIYSFFCSLYCHSLNFDSVQDGYTALHMAAVYGHNAVIALLLKAGAQLYAKDIRGRTPLDAAKDHGKDETAKQLRQ